MPVEVAAAKAALKLGLFAWEEARPPRYRAGRDRW